VDIGEIVALALGNSVVLDRFTAPPSSPAPRPLTWHPRLRRPRQRCGTDARHDTPSYPRPAQPLHHIDGDVLSRFTARVDDITTAIALITTTSST